MITNENNKKILIASLMLLGAVLLFSFGSGAVFAADNSNIYVSTHGNDSWDGQSAAYITGTTGPKLTITNATSTVTSGGTVYIENGVYKERGIKIKTNMTITGQDQGNTVIDAQKKGSIFSIAPGLNVTIHNLTLTGGNATLGGAITNNGNLTIINSTFTNNTVSNSGGAIFNEGTLKIKGGTFTNNYAGTAGGAIANEVYCNMGICSKTLTVGNITITNSTFLNNSVGNSGSAVYNSGILTVINGTFTNNTAGTAGGAIVNSVYTYIDSTIFEGNLTVINSTFINNTASNSGGAISNRGILNINNSTFTNNTAGNSGGAIDNGAYTDITGNNVFKGNATITDTYFLSNTAHWGGAICNNGNIKMNLCQFTGNTPSNVYPTPIASFSVNTTRTTVNNTIQFINTSTGDITSMNWSFGDGSTSTDENPAHKYVKAGTYIVKLTVTGQYNDISTKTAYITVKNPDTTAPTVSASVQSGTYNTNKNVTLNMNEKGTIYYTLDGSTPTTSSTRYTGAFTVTSTKTLKFIAVDTARNTSPVYTAKYVIDKTAPTISAVSPKNKATGISRSGTVSIKLSENILKSTNWSKLYIKNIKTGKKCKVTIKISGNHIYLKTSKKSAKHMVPGLYPHINS